jgi:hypothetical protein
MYYNKITTGVSMKDLPHHMKKLNRRVIRSEHREEMDEEAFNMISPPRKQTVKQVKKQAKAKLTKARNARTPTPLTPEERNKKMAKRVPVFDQNKGKLRTPKPSRKKTPRI